MSLASACDSAVSAKMQLTIGAVIMAVMFASAITATVLTPRERLAELYPVKLEALIPAEFGNWVSQGGTGVAVVNPQQAELLKRLYSQTLSRVYVNKTTGERIMLSIAYGEDERDGTQMHYPEVCYPAQGFTVKSNTAGNLELGAGAVPVRRLVTQLGPNRIEPVTYWTMIGEKPAMRGLEKKLIEMQYGLRGVVVDGLLFRVSSIDEESARAFSIHHAFVADLLASVDIPARKRLAGL